MASTILVEQSEYEYYGRQLPVLRVIIDGELTGEEFFPFNAASNDIYSGICPECYAAAGIPACGHAEFNVYQNEARTNVYWLCNSEYAKLLGLSADKQRYYVFEGWYYELQLGGSTQHLPVLKVADLEFTWESIPKYPRQLGLFTLPDIDRDSQGRTMLELFAAADFLDDAELMNAPGKSIVFQVGIDLPGTPILELEWRYHGGCYQLRVPFKSLADCWLSSNLIQSYGEQYLGQLFQAG